MDKRPWSNHREAFLLSGKFSQSKSSEDEFFNCESAFWSITSWSLNLTEEWENFHLRVASTSLSSVRSTPYLGAVSAGIVPCHGMGEFRWPEGKSPSWSDLVKAQRPESSDKVPAGSLSLRIPSTYPVCAMFELTAKLFTFLPSNSDSLVDLTQPISFPSFSLVCFHCFNKTSWQKQLMEERVYFSSGLKV